MKTSISIVVNTELDKSTQELFKFCLLQGIEDAAIFSDYQINLIKKLVQGVYDDIEDSLTEVEYIKDIEINL